MNYLSAPDRTGGQATNITVRNSAARGISVVGQSLVRISDFRIENTSSSGVLCGQDSFWKTRIPTGVQFSSGHIWAAGRLGANGGKHLWNRSSRRKLHVFRH